MLSVLTGTRVPQAKAGISTLRAAFAELFATAGEQCRAGEDQKIADLCTLSGAYNRGGPFKG